MTERIQEFLRNRRSEGQDTEPCLVVDLEVVRDNYQTFAKALPDSRVFYAVKANPSPEVLQLLASMGSCFDCASLAEIEMALAAGASPERISYGNTIKKERDIARAFALGIRLFAVDRKQRDAEPMCGGDLALFLDRVAVRDPIRRAAGREHHLGLGDRGDVEAGTKLGQKFQDFGRRVCLHGIEHTAVGQRHRKGLVVVAHDFEVDDEARLDVLALVTTVAQEFLNAFGHSTLQTAQRRDTFKTDLG